jgi:hypothetical protein
VSWGDIERSEPPFVRSSRLAARLSDTSRHGTSGTW